MSFRPSARDRFHADQRALDMRLAHRVEELRIFGRLHRDLREEHHVARKLREPLHQLEPLGARSPAALRAGLVLPASRHPQIFQRHRIEVVVGERDEPESATAEIDDLLDHAVEGALARLLAVGPPDRAERAVLRAAANGLDRRPHIPTRRQQIPAAREERVRLDASAVVHTLRMSGDAVCEDLRPDHLAVTLDDRMGAAEFARFVRISVAWMPPKTT